MLFTKNGIGGLEDLHCHVTGKQMDLLQQCHLLSNLKSPEAS